MKLYVDLETLELIEGPGFRTPVSAIRFKRGDAARLEVAFLSGGSVRTHLGLPSAVELQFAAKQEGGYDLGYLVHSSSWTMPAEGSASPVYECAPSFNTGELNDALGVGVSGGSEAASIDLMAEITWRVGGGLPTSTRTFRITIDNDVIRGTEGVPVSAAPPYPAPGAIEMTTRRGIPDGYAALDSEGRVPGSQLPDGMRAELASPSNYALYPLPPVFRGLALYVLNFYYAAGGHTLADLIRAMETHHGSGFWGDILSTGPGGWAVPGIAVLNAHPTAPVSLGALDVSPVMTSQPGRANPTGEVWLEPRGMATLRFVSSGVVSVQGDLYSTEESGGL